MTETMKHRKWWKMRKNFFCSRCNGLWASPPDRQYLKCKCEDMTPPLSEVESVIRRDVNGRCTFELHVDGSLFATGEAESVVDAAEIVSVIVSDKVDCPAAWLASEED